MRGARYLGGRFGLPVALLGAACTGALYAFWFIAFDGFWSASGRPRLLALAELLPVASGAVALAFLSPRMEWLETQSPRPIRVISSVAAVIVALTFSLTPWAARSLWELGPAYTRFVPPGWDLAHFDLRGSVAPLGMFTTFCCFVLVILSLTVLTIGLCGRLIGCLSGAPWLVLVLVVQSWTDTPFLNASRWSVEGGRAEVVTAAALLAMAATCYWASEAGGRPLLFGRWDASTTRGGVSRLPR